MMINSQKIKIYFVGIGGIGMSGIAELMHEKGYTILGSDKIESENVKRLKKIGITNDLFLMLSDGGIVHQKTAIEFPIRLVQSGPAGGAQGVASLAVASPGPL